MQEAKEGPHLSKQIEGEGGLPVSQNAPVQKGVKTLHIVNCVTMFVSPPSFPLDWLFPGKCPGGGEPKY